MSIDKNTNEGKNYRNNVVKSTSGTSKSRINTGFPEDISVLSPMMREYCKTKENYKDCILFYRLGDFYEMFFDDAILVSKELELLCNMDGIDGAAIYDYASTFQPESSVSEILSSERDAIQVLLQTPAN